GCQSVPLLLGITLLGFLLIHASGDPMALYNNNPMLSPEAKARIAETYGFDKPVLIQYFVWLSRVARGDFGHSFATFQPVSETIGQRLPNSILLMGTAFAITLLLAIPLGILSAVRQSI